MKKKRFTPSQIIVMGFISIILVGTTLLSLPIATAEKTSPGIIDSLFTATSATCVTGLIVKDTGSFFSPFGKIVILLLIQAGGLGIMTFSTMFAILLGRKLSISHNVTVQSALGRDKIEGLRDLILYIVIFTFSIELLGAGLLYARWINTTTWGPLTTLTRAVFHAVSAFCNAGFSLFSNSLTDFHTDGVIVGIFSVLIIIGGIGFVVFLDIPKLKFWRKDRRLIFSRISLQTKIVLIVTLILISTGAAGIFAFEKDHALKELSTHEKVWGCLFTSITSRTAGFNVLETGDLRPATLFMLIMLMFIGASPGSTGGGVKTVTFGIIIAAFFSMLHNEERISVFGRTIPNQIYRRAAVIVFLGITVVVLTTFLLCATEGIAATTNYSFLRIMFESTSAFGTVGLSTGITPQLTDIGKLIIIFTMFIGRVGPLTIALAIAMRKEKASYHYPEERLMVG